MMKYDMGTSGKIKNQKTEQIIGMICEFCSAKLNEEYRQLCVELAMTLDALPQAPLRRGKDEIWAAAIVYALGSKNFLFDKSFEPYLPARDIYDYFGAAGSTVSAKSRMIADILDLHRLDNRFATKRMKDWNPLNNMVMVDDMIVPLEELPEEIQKLVREARDMGENIAFRTE
jgi:hypothetical protein